MSQSGNSMSGQSQVSGFWVMALGAMGVVYGDIGTSPLYAFREATLRAMEVGDTLLPATVYGILSLMIWALIVVVTLKYVFLLLRADNCGEGGILSLTALAQKSLGTNSVFVMALGMIGAALFYGDAAITPAISVLSAVEGLELVTPAFSPLVILISTIILIYLFSMQSKGTRKVSILFGPVVTIWMIVMAAMGLMHIAKNPQVFLAFNPYYAAHFVIRHGWDSLGILGSVFLTVTGAEALYADLGHFGRKPIQNAWIYLVLPCLLLNYLGQGALVLSQPDAIKNPFFLMVPHAALIPLVILASLATIIASQAVITGAYSMTSQAIQLGFLPRLEIRHTSGEHEGQIFMPKINWFLMLAVLFLVFRFRSSGALASAYGIAVTGTMLTTSFLAFLTIWKEWKYKPLLAFCIVFPFVVVEAVFLVSNMTKLMDGGLFPLLFAGFLVLIMTIWIRGSRYIAVHTKRRTTPLKELIGKIDFREVRRISGTAAFLTGDPTITPISLIQNLKHNKCLHDQNFILTVITQRIPKVPEKERLTVEKLSPLFTRVILRFGYMEIADVPQALMVERLDLRIPLAEVKLSEQKRLSRSIEDYGRLPASDFILVGALTELNYNIVSGGSELFIQGIGGGGRMVVINVAMDLRVIDSRNFTIRYVSSLQKQVVGYEVEANVFRFFGNTLVEFDTGAIRNEPMQLAVRSVAEMSVYQIFTDYLKLPVASGCSLAENDSMESFLKKQPKSELNKKQGALKDENN